jgi:hypothetical protein
MRLRVVLDDHQVHLGLSGGRPAGGVWLVPETGVVKERAGHPDGDLPLVWLVPALDLELFGEMFELGFALDALHSGLSLIGEEAARA